MPGKTYTLALGALLSCPALAQWSTDTLSQARHSLGAASAGPLALFAGGRFAYGTSGKSSVVDVYDAATGTWSTASLSSPRDDVRAASANGVALFWGFQTIAVDVFDAATGQWSVTHAPGGSWGGQAVAVAGGAILFGGGGQATIPRDEVFVYDVSSGAWSQDQLSQARTDLAATGVGTLALFAGGVRADWSRSDRVDIYDSASGTWSQASLSQARGGMSTATVGRFALLGGGFKDTQGYSDRVDIYDSETGTWSTATLSQGRLSLAATAVGNRVLFGGGSQSFPDFTDVVDIFDAELGTLYCGAVPNSTGLPGLLSAEGSGYAVNGLTLTAEQLPAGQFGYFLTGRSQGLIQPPASQGPICLSGNIGRFSAPGEIIQGPVGSLQLDLVSMPVNPPAAVLPGETWNFQCWYRDSNPGSTSNTTNALAVTFATAGDPAVQFAVTQASLVEDATLFDVRLTLSQPAEQDVLVDYVTGGSATVGVDWRVEESNPFVIPAGATGADMTLLVAEDSAMEPDESAIVSLGAPVGAVLGTQTTFTLTIVDDD